MTACPVIFENVKIHRATLLSETATTKFFVDITNAGGEFEISESGTTVCTGHVYSPEESGKSCITKSVKATKKSMILNLNDIYKELKLRGYEYGPTFQGVLASDLADNTRVETEHAYLNVLTQGDLSSLVWVDSPLKYFTPSPNSVFCQVYYASLNFRDIMLASGKLPPDAIPGSRL